MKKYLGEIVGIIIGLLTWLFGMSTISYTEKLCERVFNSINYIDLIGETGLIVVTSFPFIFAGIRIIMRSVENIYDIMHEK